MKYYILILFSLLQQNISAAELTDEYVNSYDINKLVSYIEYFDNDHLKISYIDYFKIFPKYERVIRDNYFGYQNNCIDSRIYFRNDLEQIYEVFYDREGCDGRIKMIVDKTGIKPIIYKSNNVD